jgi:hypothetical protein
MLSAAGIQPQILTVDDFSGGMTDDFIGGAPNRYEQADNFYVNYERKLITRAGLAVNDTSNARTPNSGKINHLFDSESQLFQISDGKLYYNASGFTHVTGPSGNKALNNGSTSTFYSTTNWNKHTILAESGLSNVVRLFKDGSTWKVHQLGLPDLASTPTIAGSGVGKTYLYAFHHKVTYTSGGVTFEEDGPVTFSTSVANNNTPNVTNISLSNIPVLANGLTGNYDTANITIQIYRTVDAGGVYYRIGQVTNGTTTFTDNVADTNLALNTELYTTADGALEHEPPPAAKYVHQTNDILWLGHVVEGGVTYPNRLRISNRFSLWSCPSDFAEDFDEQINGISSVTTYPIVFCQNKIYRIEGFYNPDGSGSVRKRCISETAGCVSARSIVHTEQGLFWAGNNGFYFTDGNTVTRISELINNTYRSLTLTSSQTDRIFGTYDSTKQHILWALQADDAGSNNDTVFVCHLYFGIKPEMCFTTWSGGSVYATNFQPSAIHFFSNRLYHGDAQGYLLYYNDDSLSDVKIDTSVAAGSWIDTTIMYDYRSPGFDFGTSALRKWIPRIMLNTDNSSSISLQISINNDNSGVYRNLAEFKYPGSIAWGDYDIPFGDPTIRWDYAPIISSVRRMPKNGLRCLYQQIKFANSYTEIDTSTDLGTATFDGTANTVTLDTVGQAWPADLLDYYVTHASDSYTEQYRITARTSDTVLTLEDTNNSLPSSSLGWKLKGYRRDEILKILSYTLDYAITSQTQTPFRAS